MRFSLRRCSWFVLTFVALTLLGAPARSQVGITAMVGGSNQQIGSLTAFIGRINDAGGNFSSFVGDAQFQLAPTYRNLMDDAAGRQFRYVQIVTGGTVRPAYNGTVNTITPTFPFIDPPINGYNYQSGNGGADRSPFYENDDGGGPYFYPRYSDNLPTFVNPVTPAFQNNVPVHDVSQGIVRIYDAPLIQSGEFVTFETYLVYQDSTLRTLSQFDVLGGYTWQIARDASGTPTAGGAYVGTVSDTTLSTLNMALTTSGFATNSPVPNNVTWQAVRGYNITVNTSAAPEPGMLGIMAPVALWILVVRRRRGNA